MDKGEINIFILVLKSGIGILLGTFDINYALFDKKCKLIRHSPMGDCTDIPLLSYSLDEASKELEQG